MICEIIEVVKLSLKKSNYICFRLFSDVHSPQLDVENNHADRNGRRVRTAFSYQQLEQLEKEYLKQPYISASQRSELAEQLGLQQSNIKVRDNEAI